MQKYPTSSSRRAFLQRGLGAGVTLWSARKGIAQAPAEQRPNILFILTDDQRYDALGAAGNPLIIMPHMDRLAAKGMLFRQAHFMGGSVPAVCMPSRAMTMTGRGLYELKDAGKTIPDDHVMLPEHLRANGYDTFGTGKWHNGQDAFLRGFTHGDAVFLGGMHDHFNTPVKQLRAGKLHPIPSDGVHSTDLFSDACCRFLQDRDAANPFFAHVSFTAPHDPRVTHARYHEMYDPQALPLPANYLPRHPFDNGEYTIRDETLASWPRTPGEVRKQFADYYAMITHMDEGIGRILTALDDSGQRENTLVVLTSDNGLAVGSHGLMGKQNLYDHSVRVPMIVQGPGVSIGESSDALVCVHDIFPTVCDFLHIPKPASVTSQSFHACLEASDAPARDEVYLSYADVQRGLRLGNHKLIQYVVPGKDGVEAHTQLFDLARDPFERFNLAADPGSRPLLDRLTTQLRRAARKNGDTTSAFWS